MANSIPGSPKLGWVAAQAAHGSDSAGFVMEEEGAHIRETMDIGPYRCVIVEKDGLHVAGIRGAQISSDASLHAHKFNLVSSKEAPLYANRVIEALNAWGKSNQPIKLIAMVGSGHCFPEKISDVAYTVIFTENREGNQNGKVRACFGENSAFVSLLPREMGLFGSEQGWSSFEKVHLGHEGRSPISTLDEMAELMQSLDKGLEDEGSLSKLKGRVLATGKKIKKCQSLSGFGLMGVDECASELAQTSGASSSSWREIVKEVHPESLFEMTEDLGKKMKDYSEAKEQVKRCQEQLQSGGQNQKSLRKLEEKLARVKKKEKRKKKKLKEAINSGKVAVEIGRMTAISGRTNSLSQRHLRGQKARGTGRVRVSNQAVPVEGKTNKKKKGAHKAGPQSKRGLDRSEERFERAKDRKATVDAVVLRMKSAEGAAPGQVVAERATYEGSSLLQWPGRIMSSLDLADDQGREIRSIIEQHMEQANDAHRLRMVKVEEGLLELQEFGCMIAPLFGKDRAEKIKSVLSNSPSQAIKVAGSALQLVTVSFPKLLDTRARLGGGGVWATLKTIGPWMLGANYVYPGLVVVSGACAAYQWYYPDKDAVAKTFEGKLRNALIGISNECAELREEIRCIQQNLQKLCERLDEHFEELKKRQDQAAYNICRARSTSARDEVNNGYDAAFEGGIAHVLSHTQSSLRSAKSHLNNSVQRTGSSQHKLEFLTHFTLASKYPLAFSGMLAQYYLRDPNKTFINWELFEVIVTRFRAYCDQMPDPMALDEEEKENIIRCCDALHSDFFESLKALFEVMHQLGSEVITEEREQLIALERRRESLWQYRRAWMRNRGVIQEELKELKYSPYFLLKRTFWFEAMGTKLRDLAKSAAPSGLRNWSRSFFVSDLFSSVIRSKGISDRMLIGVLRSQDDYNPMENSDATLSFAWNCLRSEVVCTSDLGADEIHLFQLQIRQQPADIKFVIDSRAAFQPEDIELLFRYSHSSYNRRGQALVEQYRAFLENKPDEMGDFREIIDCSEMIPSRCDGLIPLAFSTKTLRCFEIILEPMISHLPYEKQKALTLSYSLIREPSGFYRLYIHYELEGEEYCHLTVAQFDGATIESYKSKSTDKINTMLLLLMYASFLEMGLPGASTKIFEKPHPIDQPFPGLFKLLQAFPTCLINYDHTLMDKEMATCLYLAVHGEYLDSEQQEMLSQVIRRAPPVGIGKAYIKNWVPASFDESVEEKYAALNAITALLLKDGVDPREMLPTDISLGIEGGQSGLSQDVPSDITKIKREAYLLKSEIVAKFIDDLQEIRNFCSRLARPTPEGENEWLP